MLDATSSSFVQYLYVLLIYKYKYYFLLNQYVIDQHLAYYLLIKIHYNYIKFTALWRGIYVHLSLYFKHRKAVSPTVQILPC